MAKKKEKEVTVENKHTAEVMYESKGCTPAGHPFLSVKKARGYYEYSERGGRDSIAFILFNGETKDFALIFESKPPMDEIMGKEVKMNSAFGGSIDMSENHTYQDICQTEVAEEAGYEVPLERIHFVGDTLVSTQMSQMCHCYLVDVTGIPKTLEAEYEKAVSKEQENKDAVEFVGNRVDWMDINTLMDIGEWKSVYIAMQAIYKNIIAK